MLFLGEKGQGKSRLMRMMVQFLDEAVPYLDLPGCPVHEDPYQPITSAAKELLKATPAEQVPIRWWSREDRVFGTVGTGNQICRHYWRN